MEGRRVGRPDVAPDGWPADGSDYSFSFNFLTQAATPATRLATTIPAPAPIIKATIVDMELLPSEKGHRLEAQLYQSKKPRRANDGARFLPAPKPPE